MLRGCFRVRSSAHDVVMTGSSFKRNGADHLANTQLAGRQDEEPAHKHSAKTGRVASEHERSIWRVRESHWQPRALHCSAANLESGCSVRYLLTCCW